MQTRHGLPPSQGVLAVHRPIFPSENTQRCSVFVHSETGASVAGATFVQAHASRHASTAVQVIRMPQGYLARTWGRGQSAAAKREHVAWVADDRGVALQQRTCAPRLHAGRQIEPIPDAARLEVQVHELRRTGVADEAEDLALLDRPPRDQPGRRRVEVPV